MQLMKAGVGINQWPWPGKMAAHPQLPIISVFTTILPRPTSRLHEPCAVPLGNSYHMRTLSLGLGMGHEILYGLGLAEDETTSLP